jgi:hypothetical protein
MWHAYVNSCMALLRRRAETPVPPIVYDFSQSLMIEGAPARDSARAEYFDNRATGSFTQPAGAAIGRPTVGRRLVARLWAGHFDRMFAIGMRPTPRTAAWAHAQRLTSVAEREAVSGVLRRSLDAARFSTFLSRGAGVELNRANILAASEVIEAVTLRLHSPMPIDARGMARLRLILADATGPLYRHGNGDLPTRIGAAMAAL